MFLGKNHQTIIQDTKLSMDRFSYWRSDGRIHFLSEWIWNLSLQRYYLFPCKSKHQKPSNARIHLLRYLFIESWVLLLSTLKLDKDMEICQDDDICSYWVVLKSQFFYCRRILARRITMLIWGQSSLAEQKFREPCNTKSHSVRCLPVNFRGSSLFMAS